jgi:hypothetical protein
MPQLTALLSRATLPNDHMHYYLMAMPRPRSGSDSVGVRSGRLP